MRGRRQCSNSVGNSLGLELGFCTLNSRNLVVFLDFLLYSEKVLLFFPQLLRVVSYAEAQGYSIFFPIHTFFSFPNSTDVGFRLLDALRVGKS